MDAAAMVAAQISRTMSNHATCWKAVTIDLALVIQCLLPDTFVALRC